jgi:hypothetical protein
MSNGIPVIGLKADRYYVSTLRELEAKVDFEDTFEKVVRTVSEENERVVVLIDQIDALSQSLSAKRDYLDTFNQFSQSTVEHRQGPHHHFREDI